MSTAPKYYIVEASALPEVFLKVAEAKRLLSTGEASTVNEATRMTDISRSAFYKYRDSVLPFQLVAVAKAMKASMTGKGFVSRWGGEEFLIVFDETEYEAGPPAPVLYLRSGHG